MLFYLILILPFINFTQCALFYSSTTPKNFKTFAVISNEVTFNPYIKEDRCIYLDIYALADNIRLCLLLHDILGHRMLQNTTVSTPAVHKDIYYSLTDFNIRFVRGYVLEKPYTSSLSGYLRNNLFFGQIHMDKRMYFIENLNKFKVISKSFNRAVDKAVFYELDDIDVDLAFKEDAFLATYQQKLLAMKGTPAHQHKTHAYWKRRYCSLSVIVDYKFYEEISESDINLTLILVINALLFANNIFETTDFDNDGFPDDLGFKIKQITIFDTQEYHNKYFKLENANVIEPTRYLELFSNSNVSQRDTCLNILLTAQIFKGNQLSVSHVLPTLIKNGSHLKSNGICSKSSMNKMIVTTKIENGDYLPVFLIHLALIHELGHMFGALDDSGSCFGFVMSSKFVFRQNSYDFYTFSNCSRYQMLQHVEQVGYCLKKWKTKGHCGNGITDPGEECDCGLSYNCNNVNFCCNAHDGKDNPCEVDRKSGFDCVPTQGFCCNKDCQFNDLTTENIDCKNEVLTCPCDNKRSFCHCGHSGICVGDYCHSEDCVYSGLLECACPRTEQKTCQSCCITRTGECLPLSQIREVYLNESNPLLRHLRNVKHINYQEFIHKIWKKGKVCLAFGKTGFCDSGSCDLEAPTVLLNKMSDLVESLKPFYEEDMRKRSQRGSSFQASDFNDADDSGYLFLTRNQGFLNYKCFCNISVMLLTLMYCIFKIY